MAMTRLAADEDPLSQLLLGNLEPPPPLRPAPHPPSVPDAAGCSRAEEAPSAESWMGIVHAEPSMLSGERLALDRINCAFESYWGCLIEGKLLMTNYRLCFLASPDALHQLVSRDDLERCSTHLKAEYYDVPLSSIDCIEQRSSSLPGALKLKITTKDCRSLHISLPPSEESSSVAHVIKTLAFASSVEELFCFTHRVPLLSMPSSLYSAKEEYTRQGVLSRTQRWARLSEANAHFELCASYPSDGLLVPATLPDEMLRGAASFRAESRVPVLAWGYADGRGSIWRSSQPKIGVQGLSNRHDDALLLAIARTAAASEGSSAPPPSLHIIDCRPKVSARANSLTGHGTEAGAVFMDLGNIHRVRESQEKLVRVVLSTNGAEERFGVLVEETGWLTSIRLLLKSGLEVARIVHDRKDPVLIHCSDGWDRTPQVASLAMMMLDPYYRTIAGFFVLIEKEFLSFGHRFQTRLGHGDSPDVRDHSQTSPVFLQFLESVSNLVRLSPGHFEFNTLFLLDISQHITSCRFGTFLCDNECGRERANVRQRTPSLWKFLELQRDRFLSPLYQRSSGLKLAVPLLSDAFLPPRASLLRSVCLWSEYWLRYSPAPSSFCSAPVPPQGRPSESSADLMASMPPFLYMGDLYEHLRLANAEADRWKRKALGDRMSALMHESASTQEVGELCVDLPSANAEIARLREALEKATNSPRDER